MAESYGCLPHTLPLEIRGTEYDYKRFDFAVMLYARASEAYAQHQAMQQK